MLTGSIVLGAAASAVGILAFVVRVDPGALFLGLHALFVLRSHPDGCTDLAPPANFSRMVADLQILLCRQA
jgi:hypothetical protein